MATEYQTAMARLAADTKIACATSADIAKAAKAKAAAQAAHATKAAQAAKVAQAEAAEAAKAAKAAKAAVKPAAKRFSFHAKAAFLTHPVYFSLAGGLIIGIVAYHLANKYWLNKDDTAV